MTAQAQQPRVSRVSPLSLVGLQRWASRLLEQLLLKIVRRLQIHFLPGTFQEAILYIQLVLFLQRRFTPCLR
jgi:hypothetical protein